MRNCQEAFVASCPLHRQEQGGLQEVLNCHLETFDLIDSQASGFADLFKVDSLVRVGHLDLGGGVEEGGGEWADEGLALRRLTWVEGGWVGG